MLRAGSAAVRDAAKLTDTLKQTLIDQARPWALAAPGRHEIASWTALPG